MANDHQSEMIQSIELVYAQALLELAEEANARDEVADELAQIERIAREQPEFVRLISTRTLSEEQRARVIENLFKSRVSDLVYRFLQVVNAKNRLDRTVGIAWALAKLVDERRGIVRVDMFVPESIDDSRVGQVARRIGEAIGGEVILRQHVQPGLIGGMKLRIEDRLIDGSVAAQLRLIRHKMVAGGRDNARTKLEALIAED